MPNLLLELFSEEIPAGMQPKATDWLVSNTQKSLKAANLSFDAIKSYYTPRRLSIIVEGLPAQQPDVSEERKGPSTKAAEQALAGFLKSTGLSKDQLEVRDTGKGEYYFAVIAEKGKATADALKPLLEGLIQTLPWQKSMRWGSTDISWARPLQNICCILDDAVIALKFAHLTANNLTYGHRFHAPEAITLRSPADYVETLRSAKVLADATQRRALIEAELNKATGDFMLLQDDALLNEVTGLVEWPVILQGNIDDRFMELPPEVMRSEMRNHQKYFTLLNPDGSAASKFLIVSNIKAIDGGKAVTAGNERVLRARLSDGQFFYDQDRKQSLQQWNEKLDAITYHAKLGSVADKVGRIAKLAAEIAPMVGADATQAKTAAQLCKSDLATGMVGEFPELQGIMGRYYAIAQGEDSAVADAIAQHYLPQGPNSPVPTAPVSIAVALADKLDTLIGLFEIGEIPTGSKDPFALRRAALGVIRIILENELRLPLAKFYGDSKPLQQFFQDRLRGTLKDRGIRHDVVEAVLSGSDDSDYLQILKKAEALQDFLKTEDGSNLTAAYKRASNMVKQAIKDNGKLTKIFLQEPDESLLTKSEEKELYQSLTSDKILEASENIRNRDFATGLECFASLRNPVDHFMNNVMVKDDDEKIFHNRLRLLNRLTAKFDAIADFEQIEG